MPKILIVNDEPSIIDVLSYNLKQAGYEVIIARDGEQAVAAARRVSSVAQERNLPSALK
jgi:two-component system alkaline phosphatase synthesis response regulator PhoP